MRGERGEKEDMVRAECPAEIQRKRIRHGFVVLLRARTGELLSNKPVGVRRTAEMAPGMPEHEGEGAGEGDDEGEGER